MVGEGEDNKRSGGGVRDERQNRRDASLERDAQTEFSLGESIGALRGTQQDHSSSSIDDQHARKFWLVVSNSPPPAKATKPLAAAYRHDRIAGMNGHLYLLMTTSCHGQIDHTFFCQ